MWNERSGGDGIDTSILGLVLLIAQIFFLEYTPEIALKTVGLILLSLSQT